MAMKISQILSLRWDWNGWKQRNSLKTEHAQILSLSGIHPGFWQRNNSWWGVRDKQGKTEISVFKARAGKKPSIVLMLKHSPMWMKGGCHLSWVEPSPYKAKSEYSLAWWASFTPPWWIPGISPHPNFTTPQAFSQLALHFFWQLSVVPEHHVGGSWPLLALRLLWCDFMLSTDDKSESALTCWAPLMSCYQLSKMLPHRYPVLLVQPKVQWLILMDSWHTVVSFGKLWDFA